MQEAERLDIEVTDVQVAGALEQIAQQNSMTEGQFLTMLRNRGVIPTTLIEQIRAQIAWQGVIQRRVRPNVEIAPKEVDEAAARLAARRDTADRRTAPTFVSLQSAAPPAA